MITTSGTPSSHKIIGMVSFLYKLQLINRQLQLVFLFDQEEETRIS